MINRNRSRPNCQNIRYLSTESTFLIEKLLNMLIRSLSKDIYHPNTATRVLLATAFQLNHQRQDSLPFNNLQKRSHFTRRA